MAKVLTIGQVAGRSGVAASALRYYEELGLITSMRDELGRRSYHPEVLRRIAFVTAGSSLGLPLGEIKRALDRLPGDRVPTKRDWERVAGSWRDRLDAQILAMQTMRDRLTSCIGCGCLSLRDCSLSNKRDRVAVTGAGPRYLLGEEPGGAGPA